LKNSKNGKSDIRTPLNPEKMRSFCPKTKIWQWIFKFEFWRFFGIFGRTGCVKKNCQYTSFMYMYNAQHIQKSSNSGTKKLFRRLWAINLFWLFLSKSALLISEILNSISLLRDRFPLQISDKEALQASKNKFGGYYSVCPTKLMNRKRKTSVNFKFHNTIG